MWIWIQLKVTFCILCFAFYSSSSSFSFSFVFFFSLHRFCFKGTRALFMHCWVLFIYCLNILFDTVYGLKNIKNGSMILFTYLKIILLQYFQFSVFSFQFLVSAKISCIQTDPLYQLMQKKKFYLKKILSLFWYRGNTYIYIYIYIGKRIKYKDDIISKLLFV